MIIRRSEFTLAQNSKIPPSTVFVALVTLTHYTNESGRKQFLSCEPKLVGVYASYYIAEMAARRTKDIYNQTDDELLQVEWKVFEAEIDK